MTPLKIPSLATQWSLAAHLILMPSFSVAAGIEQMPVVGSADHLSVQPGQTIRLMV